MSEVKRYARIEYHRQGGTEVWIDEVADGDFVRWEDFARLRAVLQQMATNELVRAIAALARQREVCREQDGNVRFMPGTDAAREYLQEQINDALASARQETT